MIDQPTLCANPVIYAELFIGFNTIEELERVMAVGEFQMEPIPREALFHAGKVLINYRKRKGTKTRVLADFFIGAHAAVAGLSLLTRDASRYASYFPTLELISPESARQTL